MIKLHNEILKLFIELRTWEYFYVTMSYEKQEDQIVNDLKNKIHAKKKARRKNIKMLIVVR